MNRGVFVPIGGSETSSTLEKVIQSVGGISKVLVVTSATSMKESTRNKYDLIFKKLGCEVDFIEASDRKGVDYDESIGKLEGTNMIFFTGGDQSRLCDCFIGSEFLSRVKAMLRNGLVVCGTSAGAVAMSNTMITGGEGVPKTGKGLSLIPNVILDSHFDERKRWHRLKCAVDYLGLPGIGLSENTGVIFRNGAFEVVGTGNATIVTSDETRVMSPGQTFRI